MSTENLERLSKRCEKTYSAMKEKQIDALLVVKEENKKYLSMFESTSYTIVISADKNYLFTDFRYIESASKLKPCFTIVEIGSKKTLMEALKEIFKGEIRLGVESETISLDFAQKLKKSLPYAKLIKSDGIVESLRAVKDDEELSHIADAEHIGDEAFSYILGEIKAGVTEREIAFKLEMKMRSLGAEALSFDTICVSGVRTSMPHGRPSDKKIEKGDFVTMDFGCIYKGYCSDMTRTVAVGSVTDEQREIYNIVLKAQRNACEKAHAGMTGSEVDALTRDIISEAGYGDYYGHGTGHGVGLEIHEFPIANPSSKDVLKENMLVTIEPGIYIPKKFGVRIEDLSIVKDSAIIILSKSEKDLIIL